MKTKIYVMTHKKFNVPIEDTGTYVPLQVGSALNEDLGYLRDDLGDNISDLNPFFGELTGYYWIWKNVNDIDIVGVCHYRRYFGINNKYITKNECERILRNNDIICSNIVKTEGKTYKEHFEESHNIKDLLLVGDAIRELYPDDLVEFDNSLSASDFTYGNLCIMRKKTFDDYCEWMFSIFTWMMDKLDLSGYDAYHKRVFGFLSENLIRVFAKTRNLNFIPGNVYITDEKTETKELKIAVFQLIKEKKIIEAKEMLISYIKYRPDVLLPLSDISKELNLLAEIVSINDENTINDIYGHTNSLKDLIEYYNLIK